MSVSHRFAPFLASAVDSAVAARFRWCGRSEVESVLAGQ